MAKLETARARTLNALANIASDFFVPVSLITLVRMTVEYAG